MCSGGRAASMPPLGSAAKADAAASAAAAAKDKVAALKAASAQQLADHGLALEKARRFGRIRMKMHVGCIFQRFKGGYNFVLQAFKPCFCLSLTLRQQSFGHSSSFPNWRKASPKTMVPATATLSERNPGRIGMMTRASATS
jgi:hypothetical protein